MDDLSLLELSFSSTEGQVTHTLILDKTYTGEVVLYTSGYGSAYGETSIQVGNLNPCSYFC